MKIVSAEVMGQLDCQTIENGMPDEVLMQQAAQSACDELLKLIPLLPGGESIQRVNICTGKGNNAGDGVVLARLLHEQGIEVQILAASPLDELTGAAGCHVQRLPAEIPVRDLCAALLRELPEGTLLLDCLLGTGIQGALRAPFDGIIPALNRSGCPVVAIDLPSGLDADSGDCDPEAVIADATITLALPKAGLLRPGGLEHCGLLRCVDIGIAKTFSDEAESAGEAIFRQDIRPFLPRRDRHGHKRSFGDLLIVGGSLSYAGAPMLAGAGALRQGTGLVRVAMPHAAAAVAPRLAAALIVHPVGPPSGRNLTAACIEDIVGLKARASAVVFGPGAGNPRQAAPVLASLLDCEGPLLVDADGLRALALLGDGSSIRSRQAPTILTPHPGEMRALLEGLDMEDAKALPRTEQAVRLAERINAAVVLKGAGTVIALPDGRSALNSSGTPALATAGTGDVLAGMIGGLLAQGLSPSDACRCATFLHGLAGELSAHGQRGLIADDLLSLIPGAMQLCSPFA